MKIQRRALIGGSLAAGASAFAQHAAITGPVPADTVWLNANESPEGPPTEALQALALAIREAGRYCHRALISVQESIASAVLLKPAEVLLGNGSSEVLHCALEAFTGPARPLITTWPTWEMMAQIAERSGRRVIKVPLTQSTWTADVERLAAEARRHAEGSLVHIGNPNNPTSTLTDGKAIRWLAANLPENAPLIVDEAYMDYVETPDNASAMDLVRRQKNVIVTRTFSKLYGLAGARIGFGCAPAELVRQMQPFRENVVGILGARAAEAAFRLGQPFVTERRRMRLAVRSEFCHWLKQEGFEFLPPAANFVLIRIQVPVVEIIPRLLARGVAVGRRFETLDEWMRITIGTAAEMQKVRQHLPAVLPRRG